MRSPDVLIVGSGPAGMSAAIQTTEFGLDTIVIDDQPQPGGQIWRSIEAAATRDVILGSSYVEGRAIAEQFRASAATYLTSAQLWRMNSDLRTLISRNGRSESLLPKAVILATGAQERPMPFPGWTLPGVLTVGAAQILLKNAGQIPTGRVWIAGSGPLPLLYATQLLRAGGAVAGYLDTTPPGQWRAALKYLPRAARTWKDLAKGAGWWLQLRTNRRVPVFSGVHALEAFGIDQIKEFGFQDHRGRRYRVDAETLLIHEGVIPNIHIPLSLDCQMDWNNAQDAFVPRLDQWGETSIDNLFVAGDGAGIGGARAAVLRGQLSATRVAAKLTRVEPALIEKNARRLARDLRRELAIRPFLDALYRPRSEVFEPADEALVCRCEEVTAGQVRALANVGSPGPNQLKSATRAGMGPCQGRQCGYTISRLLAAEQSRLPTDVGFFHIRSPLKPISLEELAGLNEGCRS